MKTLSRLLLLSLVALLMVPSANAASLSVLGGTNWYKLNDSNIPAGGTNNSTGSQLGYGGGLGLTFGLVPMLLSFEVDGLYEYHKQLGGDSGIIKSNDVQVPAIFRLWLGRHLSVGLGGFYSFGIGNLIEESTTGTQTYNGSYSGAGYKSSDYGAVGSVRINFPLVIGSVFLDGRYCYGMKSINTTGTDNLDTREVQALAGISFPIGR